MKKFALPILILLLFFMNGSEVSADNKSETTEKPQRQQVLDLSVPLKTPEVKNSGNSSSKGKRSYLPNLFIKGKDQKNQSMQVNGKFIRREEEESGKEKVVDGAGINFSLSH